MERSRAVVIKCRDYSETSQLVWLFTKDFGKIKVIAKGSRAKTKKFKGKLDLFNLIDFIFYENPRSELHTLSECDVLDTFTNIRLDLDRIGTASYICELLEASTGIEDKSAEIFYLLINALKWLNEEKEPKFVKCIFELKILQFLGHMPDINDREDVSKGVKAIAGRVWVSKAVDKMKISTAQIEELNQILRIIIDYSVGKRLKSLTFLERVKKGDSLCLKI